MRQKHALILACILFAGAPVAFAIPDFQFTAAVPTQRLAVPITPQATDYSCGAAVVLSLLTYWKTWEGNEVDLYRTLGTSKKEGTHPRAMESALKRFGLDAALRTGLTLNDLAASLTAGYTVILDIQAWKEPGNRTPWELNWDDGHYVVLVAMDRTNAYVMDPSVKTGYAFLPLDELMKRWHDYEMRTGKREEYIQSGIIVRGRTGMRQFPDVPVRMY